MTVIEQSSPSVNSRKDFILFMQNLGYGKIRKLQVRNSNPVLDPPPDIEETISLTRESWVERPLEKILTKPQITKLFRTLNRIRNGIIEQITVHDGLPVTISLKRKQ